MFKAILVTTALAHFKLTNPPTRGFDDLKEFTAPCSGFPLSTRTPFQFVSTLSITSYHSTASYNTSISFSQDPQTQSDFVPWGGVVQCTLGNCPDVPFDFQKAFPDKVKTGVNATLQVIFNSPDGILYNCGDITFTDSASSLTNSALKHFSLLPLVLLFVQ
ncbi:hypothetical protein HK103_007099 [Boothiomyces macroporosus]|uniref:Copper acquisition factor BIM1-like domain-containing protein n=1 Tax=Boothiomyces macroporosus TaxID=261099 RepID=A0AAD5UCL4_9FUNG|nr:hypothetical protein HK103_007099 [Boothiomyces macroporosus]